MSPAQFRHWNDSFPEGLRIRTGRGAVVACASSQRLASQLNASIDGGGVAGRRAHASHAARMKGGSSRGDRHQQDGPPQRAEVVGQGAEVEGATRDMERASVAAPRRQAPRMEGRISSAKQRRPTTSSRCGGVRRARPSALGRHTYPAWGMEGSVGPRILDEVMWTLVGGMPPPLCPNGTDSDDDGCMARQAAECRPCFC